MRRQPLVTNGRWCVSTTFPAFHHNFDPPYVTPQYELSVFIPRRDHPYKVQYGDGNGKLFESQEAADAYCLEHGYLQVHYPGTWCRTHRRMHVFLGHRHGTMCGLARGVKHLSNELGEESLQAQYVPMWKVRERHEKH